jgi:hypothetical protein
MSAITSETIAGYLKQIEWAFRTHDEGRVHTGFRCGVPFYYFAIPIEINVQRHWVYLRACLQKQVDPNHVEAVLRVLAALNARCHVARFLLVDGCVLLQAELPAVQCHAGGFIDALTAVCRYASMWGLDVAVLSSNASVAKLFAAVDRAETARGVTPLTPDPGINMDFDINANRLRV